MSAEFVAERSPDKEQVEELMKAAQHSRQFAYCPYSNFSVGAALLTADGTVFTGSNVENASYGLSICAERAAVVNAVSNGHKQFKALAVSCDIKNTFKGPCGACRQVLVEFSNQLDIYLVRPDGKWKHVNLETLLPMAFTPASLKEERI